MNEMTLFNKLFGFDDDAYGIPSIRKTLYSPKVDVTEEETAYILEMDLPGKTEKDVEIELDRNVLTISSETNETKNEKSDSKEEKKFLLKERMGFDFSRSFTLPEDVDTDQLFAEVKNGVLMVKMPRKAAPSPKKITVNCA